MPVNATTEFRPTDVDPATVLREAFGKSESECVAMLVTNFLASIDADWTTEFTFWDFMVWVGSDSLNVNQLYQNMIGMPGESGGVNLIVLGIHALLDGGYFIAADRDNVTSIMVASKFVEVMRCFA